MESDYIHVQTTIYYEDIRETFVIRNTYCGAESGHTSVMKRISNSVAIA